MNFVEPWLWLVPVAGLLLMLSMWLLWRFHGLGRHIQAERARESFRLQRERLEKLFLNKAAGSGTPRGLRWTGCAFGDEAEFARERKTGLVVALVSVTINFEAIEGGDMEGLPAVALPRQGSAVLHFIRGQWTTVGRAVFNLGPHEVLDHFAADYEPIHPAHRP